MTELIKRVNEELNKEYELVTIEDKQFFVTADQTFFRVSEFSEKGPIVIEYADNEEYARKGWLEDGDTYPKTLPFAQLISELKEEISNE